MKKITTLLLVAVLAFSLAGCEGKKDNSIPAPEEIGVEAENEEAKDNATLEEIQAETFETEEKIETEDIVEVEVKTQPEEVAEEVIEKTVEESVEDAIPEVVAERQDLSHVETRMDLLKLEFNTYVGEKGYIYFYTSPDVPQDGVPLDLIKYDFIPYGSLKEELREFEIDLDSLTVDHKYKEKSYSIKGTNEKFTINQFSVKIGDDVYKRAFTLVPYEEDPYKRTEYHNNQGFTWWEDYTQVHKGMVLSYSSEFIEGEEIVTLDAVTYLGHHPAKIDNKNHEIHYIVDNNPQRVILYLGKDAY